MNLGLTFLGILLFISSFFMMALILVQRGKGGGLTGALGGMGGQSAFGSKAGDVFTRITIVTAIIWITLCMVTIAAYNPPPRENLSKQEPPGIGGAEDEEEGGMGAGAEDGDSENGATDGEDGESTDDNPPEDMEDELSKFLPDDEENGETGDSDGSGSDESATDSNASDSESGDAGDDSNDDTTSDSNENDSDETDSSDDN